MTSSLKAKDATLLNLIWLKTRFRLKQSGLSLNVFFFNGRTDLRLQAGLTVCPDNCYDQPFPVRAISVIA